jgi:hypothetical protein
MVAEGSTVRIHVFFPQGEFCLLAQALLFEGDVVWSLRGAVYGSMYSFLRGNFDYLHKPFCLRGTLYGR